MFKAVRRHINATSVVALLALVLAMTGGAYAASRVIIKNISQISPKVRTQLKGAKGPAGPEGKAGADGKAGAEGKPGAEGKEGKQGEPGPPGEKGIEGKKGEKGEKGDPGNPWTPESELPEGATETGLWSFGETEGNKFGIFVPIASFTVKLKAPLDGAHVHFINTEGKEVIVKEGEEEEVVSTACLGSFDDPTATSGNLCVYAGLLVFTKGNSARIGGAPEGEPGAGRAGAFMSFTTEEGKRAFGRGTWAVTG